MGSHDKFIVLFIVGIVLLTSCAQYSEQQTQPTTPTTPTQPSKIQPPPTTTRTQQETKPIETTPAQPATDAIKEFKITAKQFQFEPSTIEVNRGDKVKLIVTSIDVPHGIAIPEYGINERLEPGKPVTIEFTADKQGSFTAFCSVFCGSGHSGMKGKITVK